MPKTPFTYIDAKSFCETQGGAKLCTYDQICPEGRFHIPVARGNIGDMISMQNRWAPISDDTNDWVYTSFPGTKLFPSCIKYSEMTLFRGPANWQNPITPTWGLTGSTFGENICCARPLSRVNRFALNAFRETGCRRSANFEEKQLVTIFDVPQLITLSTSIFSQIENTCMKASSVRLEKEICCSNNPPKSKCPHMCERLKLWPGVFFFSVFNYL